MGSLNRPQEVALAYYTKNRVVWDLGAGSMGWAHYLIQTCKAAQVEAVDLLYKDKQENYLNDFRDWKKCAPEYVHLDHRTFGELVLSGPHRMGVSFIAYPYASYGKTMGLELLAMRSELVIYLGQNFDGTSCGSRPLWDVLTKRKILCTLPSKKNVLTVYGPSLREARKLLPNEVAALDQESVHASPTWFP